jgi:hypothetical protein
MSEVQSLETPARKRAPATNLLPIVSGNMPLLFVHAIRFDETVKALSNKDISSKFATSIGKVYDIVKNKNFTYVDESWKPTEADLEKAVAWVSRIGAENKHGLPTQGDADMLSELIDKYKAAGLASAEDAEMIAAKRAQARGPVGRKKGAKKEGAEAAAPADADSLLN